MERLLQACEPRAWRFLRDLVPQATPGPARADGAKHGWAVVAAIHPACATREGILDWFHSAQKFQQGKPALGEAFAAS